MFNKSKVRAAMSGPYSDKLLLLMFILVPFGIVSFGIVHQGHVVAFTIATLLITAFSVKEKPLSWFMIYVALWALWVNYRFVYSGDRFAIRPEIANVTVIALICGSLMYFKVVKSKLSNEWFCNVVCISATIQMLLALCQSQGFTPVFDLISSKVGAKWEMKPTEMTAMLGNSNFLAAYLAISLPCFFRKYWVWCLVLLLPAIVYTGSSTAIITALAVFAVYFGTNLKRFWILGAVCISIAGLYLMFVEVDVLYNKRFIAWNKAFHQFKAWPQILFGFGPGSKWGGRGNLHNDWLSIWHTFGLIGVSFVGAYVFQTIRKVWNDRILLAAIVAVCVNCLGNGAMQLAPSVFLIIILFGLAQREVVNG